MTEREKRYQLALNQGHSAAWDLDWEKAADYYRLSLNEKPGDPKAMNNLALALFEMRKYKESLYFYLQVAKEIPQDPVALEKIAILYDELSKSAIGSKVATKAAEIYFKSGDVDKAIENWVRATVMDPENITAHSRLAVLYEKLKYHNRAIRTYLQIASIMQHSGEIDKAIQAINRALKIAPDNRDASIALEILREGKELPYPVQSKKQSLTTTSRRDELVQEHQRTPASGQTPIQEADQVAITALAGLFFEQSNEEDELKKSKSIDLRKIVNGTGPLYPKDVDKVNLRLHLGQVVEDLSKGDIRQAEDNLNRLVDIGLNHPAAFYRLGAIRFENDRLESAIRYLRHSVHHKDYALASRLILSQALRKQGHTNEAALENLEALKIADIQFVRDDQVETIRQLYDPLLEAYSQKPNEEESKKISSAIDEMLNGPDWRNKLQKIRNELSNGNDHLVPIAEVLTTVSSSQVVVAMSSIRQLAREGRRYAAIEEALFALQEVPNYLPLHITIGDILLASNQTESAIEKYKVVARTYNVRGESGRAVDLLRRVVDLSPLDLKTRQMLIDHLVLRGQQEEAIKEYIRMADVYYNLADLSQARKTYTKALRFIEQAGLDEKWRVEILHKVADIDIQSLNWRQGLIIYEKICNLMPSDLIANRKKIDLNFRLGEKKPALIAIREYIDVMKNQNRLDELILFLEGLIEDWPNEAMIKTLLADQYQQMNRVEDAVIQFNQAKEIFLNSGNTEGAMVMLKKIIDLNPKEVEEYQEDLDEIRKNQ